MHQLVLVILFFPMQPFTVVFFILMIVAGGGVGGWNGFISVGWVVYVVIVFVIEMFVPEFYVHRLIVSISLHTVTMCDFHTIYSGCNNCHRLYCPVCCCCANLHHFCCHITS